MTTIFSGLRSVGAVLAGFAVITLGTVITFTVLVSDFGYYTSGALDLAIGTVGALASGLAGGIVAGLIAGRHPLAHAAALVVPISLDSASIIAASGPGSDPLWFDLGGSAILLFGALAGGVVISARAQKESGARKSISRSLI